MKLEVKIWINFATLVLDRCMYSNFDVFLINYTGGGVWYNIVSTLHEHLHASGLEKLHVDVC